MSETHEPDEGISRERRSARSRRDEYEPRRERRPPKKSGSLAWLWIVLGVLGTFGVLCCGFSVYSVFKVRGAAVRMTSANNLKKIGVATHNHAAANQDQMTQDI